MYSQRWPQPAGQWELVSSHFMMCWRWPPWLQPWHQTKSPFTTWWQTAHMLAHCRHLRQREGGEGENRGRGHNPLLLPPQPLQGSPGEGRRVPAAPRPHRSQIQPLLLMGRLQLLQLTCRVVEAWLRQLIARHVLSLITSLEMFQSWKRCSRSM